MRLLCLGLLAAAWAVAPAAAQTSDEIVMLKKGMAWPDSVEVTAAEAKPLPAGPVKLYLDLGQDKRLRSNFLGWIKAWNKKEGKQAGEVEVVEDRGQANFTLAWFVQADHAKKTKITEYQVLSLPHISGLSSVDPNAKQGRTPVEVTVMAAPAWGYSLASESGKLRVLTQYSGEERVQAAEGTGMRLWEDFTGVLAKRAAK
jgi:hypothetical protein